MLASQAAAGDAVCSGRARPVKAGEGRRAQFWEVVGTPTHFSLPSNPPILDRLCPLCAPRVHTKKAASSEGSGLCPSRVA